MYIYSKVSQLGVALLRVVVGIIFLWAGLDKVTNSGQPGAWSAAGFLKFATNGTLGWPFVIGTPDPKHIYNPTHDFWVSLANNAQAMQVVNFLVMAGELCIGVALILGIVTRFAAAMGAIMMVLFFFAGWSFSNGIVEQHVTYAVVLLALAGMGAGNYYGLDGVFADRVGHGVRTWLMSGDRTPPSTVPAAGAASSAGTTS